MPRPDAPGTAHAPRVLVVTTTWWASDAMLAHHLREAGLHVSVLCPRGHPVGAGRLEMLAHQRPFRPVASLSRAVRRAAPDFLVPADERARLCLHALHARGSAAERALIERSLGPPEFWELLTSRTGTIEAIRAAGLLTPDAIEFTSREVLAAWMGEAPGEIVVKADGTSGGAGVRVVETPSRIDAACEALLARPSLPSALKRWLVNGDPYPLVDRLSRQTPALSAQRLVAGRVGDLALFCDKGEVLGATIAEREQSARPFGPSTIVRIVDRPELLAGARRLARRFNLSGFIGLDFIVDPRTNEAVIIELNPRATPLCRAIPLQGLSPICAAAQALGATPTASRPPRALVAYFPAAWEVNPDDTRLDLCIGDIPLKDPGLVVEMLRTPWIRRGKRVVLWDWLVKPVGAAASWCRAHGMYRAAQESVVSVEPALDRPAMTGE